MSSTYCPLAIEIWDRTTLQVHDSAVEGFTMEAWLEYWLDKFVKEDGIEGTRLPQFIGTLWAIWKSRNEQVFRQIRATEEVFQLHIRDSYHQHTWFIEDDHPRRTPPPAPNYGPPPGFWSINLGRLQVYLRTF